MAGSVSHPGDVLAHEFMAPLGLCVADLACALGVSDDAAQDLLSGRRRVDDLIARRLAGRFDTSTEFWSNLQADYDRRGSDATENQEVSSMRNDGNRATASGAPLQSPEIESKIEQLLALADGERDPDLLAEIDQMSDAIVRLGNIQNAMTRANSAYAMGRNHVVQYYGFDGTALELEMLQVILSGKAASEAYGMAVSDQAPDSLELALQAAAVIHDRAILAKEERKEFDMQLMEPDGPA